MNKYIHDFKSFHFENLKLVKYWRNKLYNNQRKAFILLYIMILYWGGGWWSQKYIWIIKWKTFVSNHLISGLESTKRCATKYRTFSVWNHIAYWVLTIRLHFLRCLCKNILLNSDYPEVFFYLTTYVSFLNHAYTLIYMDMRHSHFLCLSVCLSVYIYKPI